MKKIISLILTVIILITPCLTQSVSANPNCNINVAEDLNQEKDVENTVLNYSTESDTSDEAHNATDSTNLVALRQALLKDINDKSLD